MKKVFTLLFALGLIGNVSAMASRVPARSVSAGQGMKIVAPYGRAAAEHPALPLKVAANPVVIEESTAPTGVDKLYSTNWMCLMYDYIIDNTGIATHIRIGEGGKVYIYDLFSTGADYWVNASLSGNNLVIPLHQELTTTASGMPLTLEVSKFVFGENSMWSEIDKTATSYTLLGHADGSFTSSDLDLDWTEREYLVLADADGGVHNLIGSIVCTPVNETLVTPPANIEPEVFSYSYVASKFQQATLVNVVKDGNAIYVQGLAPALPEIWLKGEYTADGKQVTFKSGQFMGAAQYVHFFTAAHMNPNASADNPDEPAWIKDDALICNVNADGRIEFNPDRDLAITIAGDIAYNITPRALALYNETGAKPAKPVITELVWMEVDFLAFVQPTYDVDGMYLNPENLSWRMYYDNQLFTFETWEYWNLGENTTEIPYGFEDNWDFIFYNDVGEQLVAIYNSDWRSIGIESVYRVGDKEYVSERAYYGEIPTGLENIETAHGDIVDSVYHDLAGRRIAKPTGGIYIRTDRYSDGTVRTRKVSVR